MSFADLFTWSSTPVSNKIINIYPFPYLEKDFVSTDVVNTYVRVLTDVLERTQGIPGDRENLMWDNCLGSEHSDGLVTLLAKAMSEKRELYLVYRADLKLIRKADSEEERKIKADYEKAGESKTGVYIT